MFGTLPFGAAPFGSGSLDEKNRDPRATRGYGTSDYFYEDIDDGSGSEKFTAFLFDDCDVVDATAIGRGVRLTDFCLTGTVTVIARMCRRTVTEKVNCFGSGWVGFDYFLYEEAPISDGVDLGRSTFTEGAGVISVTISPGTTRNINPRGRRK